jgi:hypothetical protein
MPKKRVLLIGASIGEMWDLPNLPKRIADETYNFESITEYSPDKSAVLESVLVRFSNKPDFIILKECASYFKADNISYYPAYISAMVDMNISWVKKCLENNITPILATVVPITEKMPLVDSIKRVLKKYIFLRSVKEYNRNIRMKGIGEFNDWIRSYVSENNLIVLDLEKELRISESKRFLNPDYTTDGLHLNKTGYKILDRLMMQMLAKLE